MSRWDKESFLVWFQTPPPWRYAGVQKFRKIINMLLAFCSLWAAVIFFKVCFIFFQMNYWQLWNSFTRFTQWGQHPLISFFFPNKAGTAQGRLKDCFIWSSWSASESISFPEAAFLLVSTKDARHFDPADLKCAQALGMRLRASK